MKDGSHRTPREISYASVARTRGGRALVRTVENLTGRPRLLRMARGYDVEVAQGRDFWEVMQERFRIRLEMLGDGLAGIPAEGPLVLVANHPFGILDGLVMGRILSAARMGEFRILAHTLFRRARDLERVILPIDFSGTRAAKALNIRTRKAALDYLAAGGAIGVFPSGTVSTSAKPFSRPIDTVWKPFTARLVTRSGATVVPVYFGGHNSRLFQLASHLHYTLRMALLIGEFDSRIGAPVPVHVGRPLDPSEIAARAADPQVLMEYLRRQTYALGPRQLTDLSHGLFMG